MKGLNTFTSVGTRGNLKFPNGQIGLNLWIASFLLRTDCPTPPPPFSSRPRLQSLALCPQVSLKRRRVELTIHRYDLQGLHIHIQHDHALDLEFIAADTACIPSPADLVA